MTNVPVYDLPQSPILISKIHMKNILKSFIKKALKIEMNGFKSVNLNFLLFFSSRDSVKKT